MFFLDSHFGGRDIEESFAEINYAMMGYYKLAVILFNLTPYLVLRFAKFAL